MRGGGTRLGCYNQLMARIRRITYFSVINALADSVNRTVQGLGFTRRPVFAATSLRSLIFIGLQRQRRRASVRFIAFPENYRSIYHREILAGGLYVRAAARKLTASFLLSALFLGLKGKRVTSPAVTEEIKYVW